MNIDPNSQDADVIVHGTFAGGNASVIEELYPIMKKNLKWIHSLSAGVDGLVPHLKNCPGDYVISNAKGAFSSSLAYAVFEQVSFITFNDAFTDPHSILMCFAHFNNQFKS